MDHTNLKLQPEQLKVLSMPPQGAVQIKGVAGSGKTTVAIYRAKYLIDNYPNMFSQTNVAIFTFNRLLANYMQDLVDDVIGKFNVKVYNFHRWAYSFIENRSPGACNNTIDNSEREYILSILLKKLDLSISNKSITFISEEISWIKGKYFKNKSEYIDASRIGRGNDDKLSVNHKNEIWTLYKEYSSYLNINSKVDFDDYAIIAYELIINDKDFTPLFSHIVIDEAQDLNKIQLKTLKELVSKETNSITIIADNAQRIYKSGFTWVEIGLDFKGRTRVLKKNYRSTIQISKAAQALLMNESNDNDFTRIESARKGECLPQIKQLPTLSEQLDFALKIIGNDNNSTTVFLHRFRSGVEHISKILYSYGIPHETISNGDKNIGTFNLKVCTLSSIKGLEFDNVFIIDCSSEYIPSRANQDDLDDSLHISTERRLLYTAMTRAREKLYILYSGTESIFINQIPPTLVEML